MARAHVDEGNPINTTLRRLGIPTRWRTPFYVGFSTGISVAVILATGGANSPFLGVLILPVLIAAVLAGFAGGLIAALIGAIVCLVLLVSGPGWGDPRARAFVLANAALLILVALLAGGLSRRIGLSAKMLEYRASQAVAMHDLSQMMDSAYDLETTFNLVMITLRMLFPSASAGAVLLADPTGKRLELKASSGLDEERARAVPLYLDEEEHGWAPSDGIALLVCDATRQPHSRLKQLFPEAGSFMAVPLRSLEGVMGMIAIAARRPDEFGDRELQLAELFASRITFPLIRACRQQDLQWMAFTDGLTGLYNHRFFQEQLREEIEKSRRYKHPVSLIMLDIDHFKEINDTHGHPAGDRVLKLLSILLKRVIRQADVAARYGGEELTITCPETPKEAGLLLAERLRDAVEREEFDAGVGEPIRLTISIGVADFPDDADTASDLIAQADRALYEAKNDGRNTIRAAIRNEGEGT